VHRAARHGIAGTIFGLALALILTAIPFGVVHYQWLAGREALAVIALAAVLQALVHLRFFLRIGVSGTPREYLLALAFAALLIAIMIGGSLWIMFDLNQRMM
jgi:cytochrome o ubiquinol oxidase operon protein cyoD